MKTRKYLFAVFALTCVCASAQAEIYRWQDSQGKWHFSDTPKSEQGKPAVIRSEPSTSKPSTSVPQNIKTRLENKYRPAAIVETVTLSVVGVETHMGQGSGFFVSDSGYIVTNKHVIRPSSTDAWQARKDKMEDNLRKLQNLQVKLDEEKSSLDDYAKKLAAYKSDVDKKSNGSAKSAALSEYESFEERYRQRLANYETQQAAHESRSREFKAQYSEFNLKESMTGAARQFKIILKDNSEVRAQLVKISREHDLALLRLEGYQTPHLQLAQSFMVKQGVEVFAVGSPLGLRDAVTSGIITSLRKDYLVTDAQILPGNSGGPLLHSETGEVLGVNTAKFGESALSDGFGFAIPVSVVIDEFAEYL